MTRYASRFFHPASIDFRRVRSSIPADGSSSVAIPTYRGAEGREMVTARLGIEIGQNGGGETVIHCDGELDVVSLGELSQAIGWSMTADLTAIRIDATRVTFCDSAGLQCLLNAAADCRQRGIVLELAAGGPLMRMLHLLGLPAGEEAHEWPSDGSTVTDLTAGMTEVIAAKLARKHEAAIAQHRRR
jgi:anti-anti-sigma factor